MFLHLIIIFSAAPMQNPTFISVVQTKDRTTKQVIDACQVIVDGCPIAAGRKIEFMVGGVTEGKPVSINHSPKVFEDF